MPGCSKASRCRVGARHFDGKPKRKKCRPSARLPAGSFPVSPLNSLGVVRPPVCVPRRVREGDDAPESTVRVRVPRADSVGVRSQLSSGAAARACGVATGRAAPGFGIVLCITPSIWRPLRHGKPRMSRGAPQATLKHTGQATNTTQRSAASEQIRNVKRRESSQTRCTTLGNTALHASPLHGGHYFHP